MKSYKYTDIPNLAILHTHIESYLESSSGSIYWKDKQGAYIGVNHQFLRVSDMKSFDEVINKKDSDLLWSQEASPMMLNDKEVIVTGHSHTFLEFAKSPQKKVIRYLSYKTPLKARTGKIIGVFGISFDARNSNDIVDALYQTSVLISKQANKKFTFPISTEHNLSKQQINCLLYLTKGMTLKEIANELNLSHRTIEHYLNAVKIKLNCKSRSQLIEKALQLNVIKNQLLKKK